MILHINPQNPQQRLIDQAVSALRNGGLIAYPTDTTYGIGCDITNKRALEKILQLKKDSQNKLVSFLCPDVSEISHYAKVSNYAYKTMKRLLPGPYTFVLDASPLVPKLMITKRKTTGIRVPDNEICHMLLRTLGNPIVNASATTDTGTYFDDVSFLEERYKNIVDIVIDGGPAPNQPSSIISLVQDKPEVLREGLGDTQLFQ